MACFLESIALASAVGVYKKSVAKKEQSLHSSQSSHKIPWSRKLGWYMYLLLGGAFLLAFEHIWHGEIVPYPPFLSAMETKDGFITMLEEIAIVGTLQVVLITCVWGIMIFVAEKLAKNGSPLVRID